MPVKIELTRGFEALIDDADLPRVSKFKWRVSCGKWGNYAMTWMRIDGIGRHVYLHRFLLDFPKEQIAFINKDSLDCRRENMKLTTASESQINAVRTYANKSGFKGVSVVKRTGKYRAYIKRNGVLLHLGIFDRAEDASQAHNEKAAELDARPRKRRKS